MLVVVERSSVNFSVPLSSVQSAMMPPAISDSSHSNIVFKPVERKVSLLWYVCKKDVAWRRGPIRLSKLFCLGRVVFKEVSYKEFISNIDNKSMAVIT